MSVPPILAVVAIWAAGSVAPFDASRAPFNGFTVHSHDQPTLEYAFSKAAATKSDPVVISAVGRPLTKADNKNRVDLQKVWLARNVPASYHFISRGLMGGCGLKLPGEFHACDEYLYEDPATGRQLAYDLYVGSWPL